MRRALRWPGRRGGRVPFVAFATAIVTVPAAFAIPGQAAISPGNPGRVSPCLDPERRARLLCPDLKVAKPSEIYVDRTTRKGRVLLRATNDIQNRGHGPMELRGRRDRPRSMNVTQAIRRKGGGYAFFPTQARLRFFNVGTRYGGAYWKVRDPLWLELWRVNDRRQKVRRVRVGPKQFYCFRDLERTAPGPRSPSRFVYPACDQNPRTTRVTLGTSVGWSDIYPSTYDLQWIDVTGLRGCCAYVMRLDPRNTLHELNKRNNTSQRLVRLPYRPGVNPRC
jgi:hypothetical protein